MKVIVKVGHLDLQIIVEANPRLRDFNSTTNRIVEQVIKSGLRMGIFQKEDTK